MTCKKRSTGELCPYLKTFQPSIRGLIGRAALLMALTTMISLPGQLLGQGKSEEAGRGNSSTKKRERPAPTKIPLDRSTDAYQITENGPHHRKWERVETRINEAGEEEEIIHHYTELGTGLNRWDEDKAEWVEADELIEQFRGGAVAQGGQQKVIFAPNIKTEGAIDILNPDGVRIRSSVLGLAYFDTLTGNDVIIAEVKASRGEIVPPNQIIYRDAFEGVEADVLYTYRLTGIVQDVILRESPPEPDAFGLPNLTARLEVITEMFDVLEPEKEDSFHINRVGDPALRGLMVEPDFRDENLRFGSMRMIHGTAFGENNRQGDGSREVPVAKKWETVEERQFLFESVEYDAIENELRKLPKSKRDQAMNSEWKEGLQLVAESEVRMPRVRTVPKQLNSKAHSRDERVLLAQSSPQSRPGFVIDYTTLVGSTLDYTFERGETYEISGTVYAYGQTIFEGGSVIKNEFGSLSIKGPLVFKTTPYSPVIFTSLHDDSVGEAIAGSTGNPLAATYYSYALDIGWPNWANLVIENARFSYAQYAIKSHACHGLLIRNVQIHDSTYGISGNWGTGVKVENVLIRNAVAAFAKWYGSYEVSNVTLDDIDYLYFGVTPTVSNSLLVDVTNVSAYNGQGSSHNVELASASGVFQSVGEGHYYLAGSSPYRNIGTNQMDPGAIANLAERTTFPPAVHDGPVTHSNNLNWTPHVARDDDGSPDLGYHYPALDYLVRELTLDQNAVLTVDPGTVLAAYGPKALKIGDNAKAHLLGNETDPIHFAWYGDLQDGTDPARVNVNSHTLIEPRDDISGSNQNELVSSYVNFYRGSFWSGEQYAVRAFSLGAHGCDLIEVSNSRFFGETVSLKDISGRNHSFVNNLFDGGKFWIEGEQSLEAYNNLFVESTVWLTQDSIPDLWTLRDNVFDRTDVASSSTLPNSIRGYNGYIDTSFRLWGGTQSSDVVLTSLAFESGAFGGFYQPSGSAFIDAGSRMAEAAGLLHYTVLVGGSPEGDAAGTTTVDIGLHYPAVDANGGLIDADTDGSPNIYEDLNGNGGVDPGETPWAPGPPPPPPVVYTFQVFTPLD